jgi:hypothetical protein
MMFFSYSLDQTGYLHRKGLGFLIRFFGIFNCPNFSYAIASTINSVLFSYIGGERQNQQIR